MKTYYTIFFALLITLSLTAFGYINWNEPNLCCALPSSNIVSEKSQGDVEFLYQIDNRFVMTISKDMLDKAKSVLDVIRKEDTDKFSSFQNIQLSSFAEDRKDWVKARSEDEHFNEAQLEIIRTLDYGSSFSITGHVKKKDVNYSKGGNDTLIYYMTVVPSNSASYKDGKEALKNYLRDNSKEVIGIARKDKLRPGKISFVVTKAGAIKDVSIVDSSGYKSIDKKMHELIQETPGAWKTGTNAKGEKVDQELVFFYGLMGC